MTDDSAATGAGELKRYYLIGFPYYRAEDADAVLAASRAREAELIAALEDVAAELRWHGDFDKTLAKIDAALSPNAKEADHD